MFIIFFISGSLNTFYLKLVRLFFYVNKDMKYVLIWFLLTKIENNENGNPIFHFYLFEQGYLSNQQRKSHEITGDVLHVVSEGSVSQIFYLGPSFHFVLCRKIYFGKIPKVTRFLT